MSELTDLIDAALLDAYHRQIVDSGYWCPRCEVEALPVDDNADAPGWCPFCGLDPLADGPTQPMHATGIFGHR